VTRKFPCVFHRRYGNGSERMSINLLSAQQDSLSLKSSVIPPARDLRPEISPILFSITSIIVRQTISSPVRPSFRLLYGVIKSPIGLRDKEKHAQLITSALFSDRKLPSLRTRTRFIRTTISKATCETTRMDCDRLLSILPLVFAQTRGLEIFRARASAERIP